jgi:hypothetical protein
MVQKQLDTSICVIPVKAGMTIVKLIQQVYEPPLNPGGFKNGKCSMCGM